MEVMTDKIFWAELNAEFVTDLHALPRKISEAGKGPSWIAYDGFLRKWGSHYVTAVYTGSWLQQWSLAMVSQSYTEKDYNLRACLKLGGMTKSLKPCVPFLERDINSAISFNMTDVLYLKGGLNETRAKIRDNLTPELYEQFMLEGSSNSTTPVLYKYKPIWELLTEKYGRNSSEWQLARNIEAYYEGYLAYNCVKMQAGGGDKLLTVQDFVPVLDDFGYSYYVCMRSCRGCHFDNDCHHVAGEFKCGDEPCYCYGPTCIETDEDGHAQVRQRQTGRCAFGENTSCKYKAPKNIYFGEDRCVCRREDEPGCKDGNITIWSRGHHSPNKPFNHATNR